MTLHRAAAARVRFVSRLDLLVDPLRGLTINGAGARAFFNQISA